MTSRTRSHSFRSASPLARFFEPRSPASSSPAVSNSLTGPMPWISCKAIFVSAVVPGVGSTMDVSCCVSRFMMLLLPQFILPKMPIWSLSTSTSFNLPTTNTQLQGGACPTMIQATKEIGGASPTPRATSRFPKKRLRASLQAQMPPIQYLIHIRHRPLGGAIGPAAFRSRASRISGIFSGCQRPTPTSTSVPTILRTMLYRKPSPSAST